MGTSAYLLCESAPAAIGKPRSGEAPKETRSSRVSQHPPWLMERATGRPRICFANPHRLRASPSASRSRAGETLLNWPSPCLPCSMERATGRLRICFANPHRLRSPIGDLACSLQTLRVCFTLAPWRVRVPALGSKKHGNVTLPCLCIFLERATGLEPASVSLGS